MYFHGLHRQNEILVSSELRTFNGVKKMPCDINVHNFSERDDKSVQGFNHMTMNWTLVSLNQSPMLSIYQYMYDIYTC